jgi:hypothetical protein
MVDGRRDDRHERRGPPKSPPRPSPSVTSAEAFNSGVLFEAGVAERLIDHARQVYAAARRVETEQALLELPTVRS